MKRHIPTLRNPRYPSLAKLATAFLFSCLFCAAAVLPLANAQSSGPQSARVSAQAPIQANTPPEAQTPAVPLPSFEVASIKKHPPDNALSKHGPGIPDQPDVSQFRAPSVTVKALIAAAYGVKEFQISGGPSWIGSELWDIDAKVEDSLAGQLEKL